MMDILKFEVSSQSRGEQLDVDGGAYRSLRVPILAVITEEATDATFIESMNRPTA